MTVYADLLFIVNLYIDALLLSAVRRFLRLPLTGKRLLLASVLGGVFGLSALLPALPGVVLFPLALLESLALCATAFAPKPMTQLLKAVFLLFLFGAALSGLLTAAAYFLLRPPVSQKGAGHIFRKTDHHTAGQNRHAAGEN